MLAVVVICTFYSAVNLVSLSFFLSIFKVLACRTGFLNLLFTNLLFLFLGFFFLSNIFINFVFSSALFLFCYIGFFYYLQFGFLFNFWFNRNNTKSILDFFLS